MNLYHATSIENARLIIASGTLEPRSGKKLNEVAYLCMSSSFEGATTLYSAASDIIFKLPEGNFTIANFKLEGAGKAEYRTTQAIPVSDLLFRRKLGTDDQIRWRSCADFKKFEAETKLKTKD